MFDKILAIAPEKYRRDIVLVALAVSLAWVAFGFNSRLDAAEAGMSNEAQSERKIADIQNKQNVIQQQVSDINQNVVTLVTLIAGQQAVVHHATPGRPQR